MFLAFTLLAATIISPPAVSFAKEAAALSAEQHYVDNEVLVVFEDTPSKQKLRSIADKIDKKVKKKKTCYYKARAYKRIKGKTICSSCTAPKKVRL